jgi:lysophospholipase
MHAAPLIATPQAPIPQGARGLWFAGAGGARLRAAIVPADGPARGSVVVSPGRAEPIEKYFEVAAELQARGFFVLIHDWRGQGLSQRLLPDRLRGHAQGHDLFLADFRALLTRVEAELPRPWIALGHSMGGALTALALAQGEAAFAAALLSSPMMGVALVRQAPEAARLLARLAGGLGQAGGYILKQGYDPMLGPFADNVLTHDEQRYARFRGQLRAHPELALGAVTWGWLAFALDAVALLARPSTAKAIAIPLTVLAAGEERVVLNPAARRFAERAPQGRYAEIAGAYHEIFMETDARRALAWREFDALVARA